MPDYMRAYGIQKYKQRNSSLQNAVATLQEAYGLIEGFM